MVSLRVDENCPGNRTVGSALYEGERKCQAISFPLFQQNLMYMAWLCAYAGVLYVACGTLHVPP